MPRLYCACCGRPFQRLSQRGPAPLYCSTDCRRQMAVRRRVWTRTDLIATVCAAERAGMVAQNVSQTRIRRAA